MKKVKEELHYKNIFIFYHLLLINNWKSIFNFQLSQILESGLYDKCKEINIGVIFKNKENLYELESEYINKFDKIKLLYCRNFDLKPIKILNNPIIEINTQLGEGETILKMVEFAKTKNDGDIYLFFHSKGVTNPQDKKRSQMQYFYERGLDKNSNDDEIRKFILIDMCKEVVLRWKERIDIFINKQFYYYIWNFFWVKGSLLKKFNFDNFCKNAPRNIGFYDRHFTAVFPVNLYGAINHVDYKTSDYYEPGHSK